MQAEARYFSLTENQVYHLILPYAAMAASTRGTKPWLFSLEGRSLQLSANLKHAHSEEDKKEIYISLGCALENLIISASYFGFSLTYCLNNEAHIEISLQESISLSDPLFFQIEKRYTPMCPFIESNHSQKNTQLFQNGSFCNSLYVVDSRETVAEMTHRCLELDIERHASSKYIEQILPLLQNGKNTTKELLVKLHQFAKYALNEKVSPLGEPSFFVVLGGKDNSLLEWIKTGRDLQRIYLLTCAEKELFVRPQASLTRDEKTKKQLSKAAKCEAHLALFIGKIDKKENLWDK